MVDCLKRRNENPPPSQEATCLPAFPPSSALDETGTVRPEATTVVGSDLISKFEMDFWYNGISTSPPKLLWRSDLETNPFPVPPTGTKFSELPIKTVHGAYNTPLVKVWDGVVAPKILELFKSRGLKYSSLSTARFSTTQDGENETFGPIVIWIAVRPNTTTAAAVRDVTPDILRILDEAQITGVVVEWYEASVVKLFGPSVTSV